MADNNNVRQQADSVEQAQECEAWTPARFAEWSETLRNNYTSIISEGVSHNMTNGDRLIFSESRDLYLLAASNLMSLAPSCVRAGQAGEQKLKSLRAAFIAARRLWGRLASRLTFGTKVADSKFMYLLYCPHYVY